MQIIKIISEPTPTDFQKLSKIDVAHDKQNIPGISKIQSVSINIGRIV